MSPPSVSRSISGSSTSAAYAANGPARTLSPMDHKQNMSVAGLPDLRVSVPNYSHVAEPSSQWQGSAQHMSPVHFQHLGNASARGSWDLSTFLDSPATASPVNGQPLNYSGRHISDTPATLGSATGGGAIVTTAGVVGATATTSTSTSTIVTTALESERKKRSTRT
jgi:hypothetical protein